MVEELMIDGKIKTNIKKLTIQAPSEYDAHEIACNNYRENNPNYNSEHLVSFMFNPIEEINPNE